MKNFKKLMAVALCSAMLLGTSVTAFASENAEAQVETETTDATTVTSITGAKATIKNIPADEKKVNVKVYKVAEVDSKSNKVVVAEWAKEAVDETKVTVDVSKLSENERYLVKSSDCDVTNGTVTLQGLNAGTYYVVMSSVVEDNKATNFNYAPMIITTYEASEGTYVVKNADAVAKSSTITVGKTASDAFVGKGDTVVFTITGTIPYFEGNEYEYVVTDKATNLSFDAEDVTVTIGNKVTDVEVSQSTNENNVLTTTFNFTSVLNSDTIGQSYTITYEAEVTSADGYVNTAYDHESTDDSSSTTVTGYTGKIVFSKVDEKDNNSKLKDAEFTVKVGEKYAKFTFDTEKNVYVYAGLSDEETTETTATKVTTGEDGTFTLVGLDDATYVFHETKAPNGYSLNPSDVSVKVEANENAENLVDRVYTFEDSMADTTLLVLPFTGGSGTYVYTIIGVLLMIGAVALFFRTKNKN